MIKTIAFAVVGLFGMNKLAYHLLLKSPAKIPTKLVGSGNFTVLTHNPFGHSWTCALSTSEFKVSPAVKLFHLQDLKILHPGFPACFRLRACHEAINLILNEKKVAGQSLAGSKKKQDVDFFITFAPVPEVFPQKTQDIKPVHLSVDPTNDKSLLKLEEIEGKLLSGRNFSIFFLQNDKIITPESNHLSLSSKVVFNSIARDSMIVIFIQKLLQPEELEVSDLSNYSGGFIMTNSFDLHPVTSLKWNSIQTNFETSKSIQIISTLQQKLVIPKKQTPGFTSLCEDRFTEEAWLENLQDLAL